MDKKRLNEIKNRIYEAEGLLELMQLRDDKAAELAPMVMARLEEACGLMSELTAAGSGAPGRDSVGGECDIPLAEDDAPVYMVEDDDDTEVPLPEDEVPLPEEEMPLPEEALPEPEKEEATSSKEPAGAERSNPAFCLNDRFRFRRALFGGSDAEFNAVMDHVATMSGFDEAEDYFYGDRGLDPEDSDVADFMEIIRNYFG